jgi:hypothetical protein
MLAEIEDFIEGFNQPTFRGVPSKRCSTRSVAGARYSARNSRLHGSAPAITARVDPIGTPTVCDRVRTGRGKSGAEGQSHSQWLVLLAQKAMPGRYPDRLSTKSARRLIARRSGPPY